MYASTRQRAVDTVVTATMAARLIPPPGRESTGGWDETAAQCSVTV